MESLSNNPQFVTEVTKSAKKLLSKADRKLSLKDSCELLVGRCDLSQREYLALKKVLCNNNITIASYSDARAYAAQLEIGKVDFMTHFSDNMVCPINCMHASTYVIDTLKLVVSNEELFRHFNFVERNRQESLFSYLKAKSSLFNSLDITKRTIFIRDTGDNFRASKNYPTEQISFSILNIKELLNSPYGQFATSLYRGTEKRETLISHGLNHFDELETLVQNGISLQLPDKSEENFNVVVFFVADLGYVKEVIGKASCMSMYGCYRCTKKINDWDSEKCLLSKEQTVDNFRKLGQQAVTELGDNPNKESTAYKDFIRKNFGQWVCTILLHFN